MGETRKDKFAGWMPGLYRKAVKKGFIYYTLHGGAYRNLGNDIEPARKTLVDLQAGAPLNDSVGQMLDDFMAYRREKHRKSAKPGKPGKPSLRTLADNAIEVANLKKPFSKIPKKEFKRAFAFDYLHKFRGVTAPVRANREISLLASAFEYEIDRGTMEHNPVAGVEKNIEEARDRLVTRDELLSFCKYAIANTHHAAGSTKKDGDSGRRIALAAQLAYLTGKAEGQILRIARKTHVLPEGVKFTDRKGGNATLAQYTPALLECTKALLDLPVKDPNVQPMYLVCRPDGASYTVSGFSSLFRKIHAAWLKHEAKEGRPREAFTFHDLRAMAVTKVKEDGRQAKDVTGHTTEKTADDVYDRRRIRKAKAVE